MNGLRNNLPSWWMQTPIQKGLLNQNEKTWDKLHMSFDMAPSITTHIKKCVFSLRPWTAPYQKDWTVSSVGRAHSRLKLSNGRSVFFSHFLFCCCFRLCLYGDFSEQSGSLLIDSGSVFLTRCWWSWWKWLSSVSPLGSVSVTGSWDLWLQLLGFLLVNTKAYICHKGSQLSVSIWFIPVGYLRTGFGK